MARKTLLEVVVCEVWPAITEGCKMMLLVIVEAWVSIE